MECQDARRQKGIARFNIFGIKIPTFWKFLNCSASTVQYKNLHKSSVYLQKTTRQCNMTEVFINVYHVGHTDTT